MVTSALAVEERNAFGSKNGAAVSDSDTTSHSQISVCRNVGTSVKFMINLLSEPLFLFLFKICSP